MRLWISVSSYAAIYIQKKIDSYLYKYCRDLDSAFSQTLFCGCLAGLVIGCILDFFHFMKSQKRLKTGRKDYNIMMYYYVR